MPWALVFALANAGNNRPARIAMMAMTTSSSIKVKPALRAGLPTGDVRESFIIFRSVSYLGHEKHSESQLNCNCAFHRPPLCGRKHSAENGFPSPLRSSDSGITKRPSKRCVWSWTFPGRSCAASNQIRDFRWLSPNLLWWTQSSQIGQVLAWPGRPCHEAIVARASHPWLTGWYTGTRYH